MSGRGPEFLPTEEGIQAECLEIQKGWTEKERFKRMVEKPSGVIADTYTTSGQNRLYLDGLVK